jgi:elongator complex protein 4
MSFKRKSLRIGPSSISPTSSPSLHHKASYPPGVRLSPVDGWPTISTGTPSLDQLLGGHSGLRLGNSLLVEEHGTTDFSGVLLRYYGAEGLAHGHHIHLLGYGSGWRNDLPGVVAGQNTNVLPDQAGEEKMKIAWRYETLRSRDTKPPGKYGTIIVTTSAKSFP